MKRRILPSFSISKVRTKALLMVGTLAVMLTVGVSGFLAAQRIGAANAVPGGTGGEVEFDVTADPYPAGAAGQIEITHADDTTLLQCPSSNGYCLMYTLKATATIDSGWYFVGWYIKNDDGSFGDLKSENPTYEFIADSSEHYRFYAKFENVITVSASPSEGGSPRAIITKTTNDKCDGGMSPRSTDDEEPNHNNSICYSVSLTSNPNSGYEFDGWYKDNGRVSKNDTYTFYTTGNGDGSGAWEARYTKSGSTEPTSIIVDSCNGNPGFGEVTLEEKDGVKSISATPIENYNFIGWWKDDGGNCQEGEHASVDNPLVNPAPGRYYAKFGPQDSVLGDDEPGDTVEITVKTNDKNQGLVTFIGDYQSRDCPVRSSSEEDASGKECIIITAQAGDSIDIQANPKPNYRFDRWNGGDTSNPRTITVTNESAIYTAYFAEASGDTTPTTYTYIIKSDNAEEGLISVNNEAPVEQVEIDNAVEGQSITIAAHPREGYKFDHWSDKNTKTERTIEVVATDKIYTAYFVEDSDGDGDGDGPGEEDPTYTITVESHDATMGKISVDGEDPTDTEKIENVNANNEYIIKAIPEEGYKFDHWSDGNKNAERTIKVTENATYTAYFVEDSTEPVPDTSADTADADAPDTGANTNNDKGNTLATTILVPMLAITSLVASVIIKRRGGHVKFD